VGDLGKLNVICGQLLAINLETPNARVSGNFINFLPDGSIFDFAAAGVNLGADNTYEFYENGWGDHALIGTDGDTINDANELNFVGPIQYGHYIEFWGQPATHAVMAGNYMGMDQLGNLAYTNAIPSSFAAFNTGSIVRIGSSFKGDPSQPAQASLVASDYLAFNYVANLQKPFLDIGAGTAASVVMAGNVLINNYGAFPLDTSIDPTVLYGGLLANPLTDNKPVISTNSTVTSLIGTLPETSLTVLVANAQVSFYLADPLGLSHSSSNYPSGWVQGLTYLGTYVDNGVLDLDPTPNSFNFDISALNLGTNDMWRVIGIATYVLSDGTSITGQFSDPVSMAPPPSGESPELLPLVFSGTKLTLQWTGGSAPFTIQRRFKLSDPWSDVSVTELSAGYFRANAPTAFFRVLGN
jgi:hypothetical protein